MTNPFLLGQGHDRSKPKGATVTAIAGPDTLRSLDNSAHTEDGELSLLVDKDLLQWAIGVSLRTLRVAAQPPVSQAYMGKVLGLSQPSVSKIEGGSCAITFHTILLWLYYSKAKLPQFLALMTSELSKKYKREARIKEGKLEAARVKEAKAAAVDRKGVEALFDDD
jgi:transcriptional regulator with XRE-family HTH domain